MHFSRADLARRTEQARPDIERLTAAGCRFAQMEVPDNNGIRKRLYLLAGVGSHPARAHTPTLASWLAELPSASAFPRRRPE
jgi:hypothetical protein